jgi:hypothetical protein
MSVLNISQTNVSRLSSLAKLPAEYHEPLLTFGLNVLEGDSTSDTLDNISGACGVKKEDLYILCQSAATMFWEFAKGIQKDMSAIGEILRQLKFPEVLIDIFMKVYKENKTRIANLKGSLALSNQRYKDLTWRLDVELARRNMHVVTEPKFMLRLDVTKQDTRLEESYHLQADYANMKRLNTELSRALKEAETVHCQRLSRYIT